MKKRSIIIYAVLCAVTLSACNTAKTLKETTKEDLVTIEEGVKKDVSEAKEISKEKIDEAVTYLHENMNKINEMNQEAAQNIYEYSVYLEEAAKKDASAIEHDIAIYASKSKAYVEKTYTATKEELKRLSEEGTEELKTLGASIQEEKDKLIEEFHALINK